MSSGRNEILDKIKSNGNWVPVPHQLLALSISSSAKLVYMYFLTHREDWNPTREQIVAGTDLSKNTVTKALIELNDAKMILSERDRLGEKTIHRFNSDFDFNVEGESEISPFSDKSGPEIGPLVDQKLGHFHSKMDQKVDQKLGYFYSKVDQKLGHFYSKSGPEIGPLVDQKLGHSGPEIGPLVDQKLGHIQEEQDDKNNKKEKNFEKKDFLKNQKPEGTSPPSEFSKNEKMDLKKEEEKTVKATPSFRTMVSLLQRETGGRIPNAEQIDAFVISCKDSGLPTDELTVRIFVSAFFDGALNLRKKIGIDKFNSWRDNVEKQFEQSKATAYFAGSLDMAAEVEGPPGKIYYNRAGQAMLDAATFDALLAGMDLGK